MTCKPLYLAAERAYLWMTRHEASHPSCECKAIILDLHEALGLDEEPAKDWWRQTMADRAIDDNLNKKHGLD